MLWVLEMNENVSGLFCLYTIREKMPFHHVTAGLLYKGNYLNRSLSAGSDSEQLANISVEELDGKDWIDQTLDRKKQSVLFLFILLNILLSLEN